MKCKKNDFNVYCIMYEYNNDWNLQLDLTFLGYMNRTQLLIVVEMIICGSTKRRG